VGFIGEHGRGTHEHHGVMGKVDIITGTLGKALGGASGGYIASSKEVVSMLRQRSRPYLFSNSLAPSIVAASLKVLAMLREGDGLRRQLRANAVQFRAGMEKLGFTLLKGEHPIIPIMLYDAPLAQKFATGLLEEGVYVTGFFFPVVPKGQARIRTQMSAAHSAADIDAAIQAFAKVGRSLGVIK
jgi:glycine C-acetyltransferase